MTVTDDLTTRAREIAAGLTPAQRDLLLRACDRREGLLEASEWRHLHWVDCGSDHLVELDGDHLVELDGDCGDTRRSWNSTRFGRAVAAVLAEGAGR
jgi:hypothetical protein